MATRAFKEETPSPKKKGNKKKNKQKKKKKDKKKEVKVTSPVISPPSPLEIDEYNAPGDTMDNRTFCFKISQGSSGC